MPGTFTRARIKTGRAAPPAPPEIQKNRGLIPGFSMRFCSEAVSGFLSRFYTSPCKHTRTPRNGPQTGSSGPRLCPRAYFDRSRDYLPLDFPFSSIENHFHSIFYANIHLFYASLIFGAPSFAGFLESRESREENLQEKFQKL